MKTLKIFLTAFIILSSCKNKDQYLTDEIRGEQIDTLVLVKMNNSLKEIVFKKFSIPNNYFKDSNKTLKGIKSIVSISYGFKFGKKELNGIREYVKKYNRNGKIQEITNFSNNDFRKALFTYNENGRILNCNIFSTNNNPVLNINFNYDNSQNIKNLKVTKSDFKKLEEDTRSPSKNKSKLFFGFISLYKNEELQSLTESSDIDINKLNLYEYESTLNFDSNQNISEVKVWNEDGTLYSKIILDYDSLKNINKIVTYRLENYEFKNSNRKKGTIDRELYKDKEAIFNNDTVTAIFYKPNDSIYQESKYFIKKENLSIIKYDINKDKKENWYSFMYFDNDGKIITDRWSYSIEKNYIYNEENVLIKTIEYKSKSSDTLKIVTEYNELGNKEDETEYNMRGEVKQKIIFKYDDKNNLTVSIVYDSKGNVEKTTMLKYNDNNLLEEKLEKDKADEPIKLVTFNYEFY